MNKKNIKRLKGEPKKSFDAFVSFVMLSEQDADDIFQTIADSIGYKIMTIYNWSSKYQWKERYKKLRLEANKKAIERLSNKIEHQDIRHISKIIDKMREVEENTVGVYDGNYSIKDYETIVKLYYLATGKATERTDNSVQLTDEDKKTLEAFSVNIANHIQSSSYDQPTEGEDE